MKIKVLTPNGRLCNKHGVTYHVGEIGEVDASIGNECACLGMCVILDHGSPKPEQPKVAVKKTKVTRPLLKQPGK